MPSYRELFLPTLNALDEFNKTLVLVIMLVIVFSSILHIIFSFKHLMLIFRNRHYSIKQDSYIIFKILFMMFLAFIIYEITNIILQMS